MAVPPGIEERELIYLAGFFDGEGYVGISGRRPELHVKVAGTNKASIVRFQHLFGGSLSKYSDRYQRRETWGWDVVSFNAKNFLETVLPYLAIKKIQAAEALKFPLNGRGKRLSPGQWDGRRVLSERLAILKRL